MLPSARPKACIIISNGYPKRRYHTSFVIIRAFFRVKRGPLRGDERWPCTHVLFYSVLNRELRRRLPYTAIFGVGWMPRWLKNRELVEVDGAAAERSSARTDPNAGDSIRRRAI